MEVGLGVGLDTTKGLAVGGLVLPTVIGLVVTDVGRDVGSTGVGLGLGIGSGFGVGGTAVGLGVGGSIDVL